MKCILLSYPQEMQQHDVQELNRILFAAIESSLVGTSGEHLIGRLYRGTAVQQVLNHLLHACFLAVHVNCVYACVMMLSNTWLNSPLYQWPSYSFLSDNAFLHPLRQWNILNTHMAPKN